MAVYTFRNEWYPIKDKDPIIDRLKTMAADEGVSPYQAALLSGLSAATPKNWFDGPTRRPQFCSIIAFSRALGYEMDFHKKRTRTDLEADLAVAAKHRLERKDKKKANGKGLKEFKW